MYTLESLQGLSVSRIRGIAKGLGLPGHSKVTAQNRYAFELDILRKQKSQVNRRVTVARMVAQRCMSGFAAFSEDARIHGTVADIKASLATQALSDHVATLEQSHRAAKVDAAIAQTLVGKRTEAPMGRCPANAAVLFHLAMIGFVALLKGVITVGCWAVVLYKARRQTPSVVRGLARIFPEQLASTI